MRSLKRYTISFTGLKEGIHKFRYQIDNTFFEEFQYNEFNEASVNITIDFIKKSTLFELFFTINGYVNVLCDSTNEPYNQEIKGNLKLTVKFSSEFNDEDDEILILPHGEHQINVDQYIYELVVLSVPCKKIHPDVLNETMKSEILEKLKELEVNNNKTVEKQTIDPRWDKLKDLLTGKNT